jgi:hypothetical protein
MSRKVMSTIMKEVSCPVAAAIRRVGVKGALASTMFATATFAGLATANASVVTMTVTGTVASGTDMTGVFGTANANLTGETFKLTYTFDDTKGTVHGCAPNGIAIGGTGTASPGTAVLQIGGGTFTFGKTAADAAGDSPYSTAELCGEPSTISSQDSYSYTVEETFGTPATQYVTDVVSVSGAVPAVSNVSWETPLSATQVQQPSGDFSILLENNSSLAGYAKGTLSPSAVTVSGPQTGSGPSSAALQFVPITPCRIADTRNSTGPFGGPELGGGTTREFDIPQSACSIPASATAYSLNVTVVPNGFLGYLTAWPTGQPQPSTSTLNSDGRYKANAAIIPAGTNGGVNVFVSDPSQVVLDISGYFVPAGTSSALAFYPLTPCRLVDTRNANGPLGGPTLVAGSTREFPLRSGSCNLPSDAAAYSLNVTAVPQGSLPYLTIWPSGQSQPTASSLNAPTGTVTANGAIVPAGSNGGVTVYVGGTSDVVIDVNGYFAAPGAGGLTLHATTPCRVLDTRNGAGAFTGVLSVNVESSTCAPPSSAQAYVVNATVVPSGMLGYLTLWPAGQTQPQVSTLNAYDGVISSNMAIVPTLNGSINAFAANPTQLILDLFGYYAP